MFGKFLCPRTAQQSTQKNTIHRITFSSIPHSMSLDCPGQCMQGNWPFVLLCANGAAEAVLALRQLPPNIRTSLKKNSFFLRIGFFAFCKSSLCGECTAHTSQAFYDVASVPVLHNKWYSFVLTAHQTSTLCM